MTVLNLAHSTKDYQYIELILDNKTKKPIITNNMYKVKYLNGKTGLVSKASISIDLNISK